MTSFHENTPLFPKIIEFQTCSSCNGKCVICPHADVIGDEHHVMPDETISSILRELEHHKTEIERVIPYLNNEPLLDPRIIDILHEIKKQGFVIELSTNASPLTQSLSKTIVDNELVDDFRISIFGGNKFDYENVMTGLSFEKTIERISFLVSYARQKDYLNHISFVYVLHPFFDAEINLNQIQQLFPGVRIQTFGYLDRASNVDTFKNCTRSEKLGDVTFAGCSLNRPFERMCILWDGSTVLCSQDWRRAHTLGVVGESTIAEVWNSKASQDVRRILSGEPSGKLLCNACKLALLDTDSGPKLNFLGDNYMDENDKIRIGSLTDVQI